VTACGNVVGLLGGAKGDCGTTDTPAAAGPTLPINPATPVGPLNQQSAAPNGEAAVTVVEAANTTNTATPLAVGADAALLASTGAGCLLAALIGAALLVSGVQLLIACALKSKAPASQ
jgi:hypothetical protein